MYKSSYHGSSLETRTTKTQLDGDFKPGAKNSARITVMIRESAYIALIQLKRAFSEYR